MTKPLKQKKNKVPRITEAEYTAYVTALKGGEGENRNEPQENRKTEDTTGTR